MGQRLQLSTYGHYESPRHPVLTWVNLVNSTTPVATVKSVNFSWQSTGRYLSFFERHVLALMTVFYYVYKVTFFEVVIGLQFGVFLQSGNVATVEIFPDGIHGFLNMGCMHF